MDAGANLMRRFYFQLDAVPATASPLQCASGSAAGGVRTAATQLRHPVRVFTVIAAVLAVLRTGFDRTVAIRVSAFRNGHGAPPFMEFTPPRSSCKLG